LVPASKVSDVLWLACLIGIIRGLYPAVECMALAILFRCSSQVVQLQELFDVRHSVFIVGNAGTGKSMVWKSLFKANQIMKKKPTAVDLNPKAVTNNELFGIINPATREWKDGQSQSCVYHVDS